MFNRSNIGPKFGFHFVWLIAALLFLGGCLYSVNVPNDPESQGFVNSLTSQILAPGGQDYYRREASPELLQHLSVVQFDRFATRLRAALGQPIGPNSTNGITRIIGGTGNKLKIAQYSVIQKRQRGTATLTVDAKETDDVWQLTGLVINAQPSLTH